MKKQAPSSAALRKRRHQLVRDLPPVERTLVRGPALVAEPDCTVWIPDGWRAEPAALGAWVVTRG